MRTKIWLGALVLTMAFAAACNGQIGDAISSAASGTPLPSVSRSISLPITQRRGDHPERGT